MLKTVDEVVDALGGTGVVAAKAGLSAPAVSNWRARGRLPSDLYLFFSKELNRLGKRADPDLFGQKYPEAV